MVIGCCCRGGRVFLLKRLGDARFLKSSTRSARLHARKLCFVIRAAGFDCLLARLARPWAVLDGSLANRELAPLPTHDLIPSFERGSSLSSISTQMLAPEQS